MLQPSKNTLEHQTWTFATTVKALAFMLFLVCGVGLPSLASAQGSGDMPAAPSPATGPERGSVPADALPTPAPAAAASTATVARAPARPRRRALGIRVSDGDFGLVMHPIAAIDYQVFIDSKQRGPSNRFQVPLAALVMTGTLREAVELSLFAGHIRGNLVLLDAWAQARISPTLAVRAGKQRVPLTDERLSNSPFLPLFAPAAASSILPNRDVGIRAFGSVAELLTYDLGVFGGNPANTIGETESDNGKDVVARVLITPFARAGWPALQRLRLGVAGSYGRRSGTPENPGLPVFRSLGGTPFFTYGPMAVASGRIARVVPQVRWEAGPMGFYADYAHVWHQVSEREAVSRAWHMVGRVVVTGERATFFRPVVPRRDVSRGGIGSIELAATLGRLDLDEDLMPDLAVESSPGVWVYGGGVSWYPYTALRLMVNFERTDFDAPGDGAEARSSENLMTLRAQVVL